MRKGWDEGVRTRGGWGLCEKRRLREGCERGWVGTREGGEGGLGGRRVGLREG